MLVLTVSPETTHVVLKGSTRKLSGLLGGCGRRSLVLTVTQNNRRHFFFLGYIITQRSGKKIKITNMSVQLLSNLKYGPANRCVLDVFRPTVLSRTLAPVALVVHGGAWMIGDKKRVHEMCRVITGERGMISVACNYRLSPFPMADIRSMLWWLTVGGTLLLWTLFPNHYMLVVVYIVAMMTVWLLFVGWCEMYVPRQEEDSSVVPQHLEDVDRALQWVTRNIHKYGGDPRRVILLGHSAGAHLVSLLASKESSSKNVLGVVCVSGVYSYARMKEISYGEWLTRCAFGKRDDYIKNFPIHNISEWTPPHLLLNATDDMSLIRHTWDMMAAMRAKGKYVKCRQMSGDHYTIIRNWATTNRGVWTVVNSFFEELLEERRTEKEAPCVLEGIYQPEGK